MTRKSGKQSMRHTEHWRAVSTSLGLIIRAYRTGIELATTECRAETQP